MSEPPMAKPRVASGVLIRDDTGRILLVKPTYKDGWEIPGGYVEPGESPKQAAKREVQEELGIDILIGRLLVVDWAPHPDEGDKLLFIFDAGQMDNFIKLGKSAPDEIEEARFWAPVDLKDALACRIRRRVLKAIEADLEDPYLEYGAP